MPLVVSAIDVLQRKPACELLRDDVWLVVAKSSLKGPFPATIQLHWKGFDKTVRKMARITVEDCLEHVENRFNLVLLAARRARQLEHGVEPLVPWDNDKPTVVALREIAAGLITSETVEAQEQKSDSIDD